MRTAVKQTVTVQEGGQIEVRSSELLVGARAEVIILPEARVVDDSEEWTDVDLTEFSSVSWELFDQRIKAQENA